MTPPWHKLAWWPLRLPGLGRLKNRASLKANIALLKPTHVFNAANIMGRPNVDRCESHKVKTIQTNVVETLILVEVCRDYDLFLVN